MNENDGMIRLIETTDGNYYAYEGKSGRIFSVKAPLKKDTYEETEKAVREGLEVLGITDDEPLSEIRWRCSFEKYKEGLKRYVYKLLLQLTCKCNLSCDYCVYSGNYEHVEPRSDNDMPYETVVKSIDFYREHNVGCEEAVIDFYGGEAFLKFDIIKKAVEYAKAVINDKPLKFRITTNGLLLNKDIVKWLSENPQVYVTVTVNGPFHDEHRKTPSGSGSLDIIMQNVDMIKKDYPVVWDKQISFIANIAGTEELVEIKRFYETVVGKAPASISHIRRQDGNESINKILKAEERDMTAKLREEYCRGNDAFLAAYYGLGVESIRSREVYTEPACGYVGSCLAGMEKLFVHYDGKFGICESACDKVILGNIENGFDTEALKKLYEGTERLLNKQCRSCWAQRLCKICYKDIIAPDGTVLDKISEERYCRLARGVVADNLQMYCEILSADPDRLKDTEV